MKARVKATGEILEVEEYHKYLETGWKYKDNAGTLYKPLALDFSDEAVIGYWTRLEQTYAGMAIQGILSNANHALWDRENNAEGIAKSASAIAHALVEKMKNQSV